jgi:hypothetical protein
MIDRHTEETMIRTAIHLTEKQVEDLKQESNDTGLPVAEIIRRAIDEYLEKRKKQKQIK